MIDSSLTAMLTVRSRLGRIIASREDDFLALGADLHALSDRVELLAQKGGELIETTSGAILHNSIAQLADKMVAMRSLCATGDGSDLAEISKVRAALAELVRLLESYGRIVRTLQMLGISTRIESARLGTDGKGFTTLADDVEKLGLKIVEYSASIRGFAERLEQLSLVAHDRITTMQSMQTECSVTLFDRVQGNLERLRAHSEKTVAASRELSAIVQAVHDHTGEIVSSVQFHDIVRQQVEHVEEALDESARFVKAERGRHPEQDVAQWLSAVNTVQASQLDNARQSFSRAVQGLRTGLNALGGQVDGVHHVLASVSTGETGESPLATIGGTVREIAERFGELARQGESMGNVMMDVANTVSDMTAYLDKIEEVGAEIELIALNASIKAAHTGDMGKALGVLATSIQRLSQDAAEQTSGIAANLTAVDASAMLLREHAATYLDTSRAEAVVTELSGLMTELRSVQGRADGLIETVDREASDLSHETASLAQSIRVDEDVCAALAEAQESLEHLVSGLPQQTGSVVLPPALQALLDRYTMESERHIHRTLLGRGGHGTSAHAGDDVELFDDSLGDNVELF
ncbi:methyl-accepting chemotaxis protein [Desulfovibrio psychrotolerans]|uniref:Arginine N-succinyltransferase n=1 Tax=Desulfovibrio psychrotolerans TaxID=415242 RepID=A0A7J0BYZ9_9BACT|nr:methyl-accepting chemotaxis protein [Desulfovibrio psychrotolerans]GFM38392.1 arginine N-succinyltransferase [Desulfovibrio psychrotolerans]